MSLSSEELVKYNIKSILPKGRLSSQSHIDVIVTSHCFIVIDQTGNKAFKQSVEINGHIFSANKGLKMVYEKGKILPTILTVDSTYRVSIDKVLPLSKL